MHDEHPYTPIGANLRVFIDSRRNLLNLMSVKNLKIFSMSYRGLKFCVNTGYLLTFSVIFLQIKKFL